MKINQGSFLKALFASIIVLIVTVGYAHSTPPNAPKNLRLGVRVLINHYFTGLPMTADGWTDLLTMYQTPGQYDDSRVVYVSTSGNDSTGIYYSPGDTAIGSDPFNPSDSVAAYATIVTAYNQLRDGYADIMLLKRGDTWNNDPKLDLNKSGKSKAEPMIIAAYGSSGDLPKRLTSGEGIKARKSRGPHNYVVIANIHHEHVSGGSLTGLNWTGDTDGALIEGCRFISYHDNIIFQNNVAVGSPYIDNIALRRNIIADSYCTSAHSQGIYTSSIYNCLIEENVFDHNGWHDSISGAEATIFNRSMYLNKSPLMTVRGNIDARGAAGGVQLRHGGTCEYNLSLQNPLAISTGHAQALIDHSVYVKYNVVLDSRNINTLPRGFGISVGNRSDNAEIADNIIAHQKSGTDNIFALFVSNETNMTEQVDPDPGYQYVINPKFTDNIIYKWDLNGSTDGQTLYIGQAVVGITVRDNIFYQPNRADLIYYYTGTQQSGPDETWVFSGNTYCAGSNTTPFDGNSLSAMNYTEWVSHVSELDSTYAQVTTFPDPERTIESYALAMGLNPTGYQDGLEKFLSEARKQSRFNWRKEYTALSVINYIREGFGRESVSFSYVAP